MVFNSAWVGAVARASAEGWQYVACNPERLSGEQVLDLLCSLPLRQLRRLALALFSFFCFPYPYPPPPPPDSIDHQGRRRSRRPRRQQPRPYRFYSSSSSSSSSSDSAYDSAGGGYDPHSD